MVVGGENALRGDMDAVLGAGCRGVHKQMGSLPRQPDPSHSRYPDARDAVRAGQYPDGLDFYLAVGKRRGDVICAPSTIVWGSTDGDD